MPQMATADTTSATGDTSTDSDDSDFEYYPQVTAHAPSAIEGEVVDTVMAVAFSHNQAPLCSLTSQLISHKP